MDVEKEPYPMGDRAKIAVAVHGVGQLNGP